MNHLRKAQTKTMEVIAKEFLWALECGLHLSGDANDDNEVEFIGTKSQFDAYRNYTLQNIWETEKYGN
jgi:hypothetical protein